MLSRITIAQSRYLGISTSQRYLQFCNSNNIDPKTIEVEVGVLGKKVLAHWVGDPHAQVVIVYFHGGGYTQPATEGYFQYMKKLVAELNASKSKSRSVAVLMLAYSLAPEHEYPTQLQEAAALLSYLTKDEGRSPGDIFLTGDSAGGGLCFSLLSHILHPRAGVPELSLRKPLAGIMAYSPWVSFRTDADSFQRNAQRDMIPAVTLHRGSAMFLGKSDPRNIEADLGPMSGDPYSEPGSNPSSWWKDLNKAVSNVYIWVGSDEVLVDIVRDFASSLREGLLDGGANAENLILVETPDKAHIGPIAEGMQSTVKSEHQLAIEQWYKSLL